jgi:hypothetical protein
MPRTRETLDLEEGVITLYAALDDALKEAGLAARAGKLLPRPGPAPDVDDREVLCLAVLQALLGFESDHAFYQWLESDAVLRQLFPRRLTRSNGADRRALLTPLVQRLPQAFCALDGEEAPPPFHHRPASGRCLPPDPDWPPGTPRRPRPTRLLCIAGTPVSQRPRAPGVHAGRPDLHPTVHSCIGVAVRIL